MVPRLARITLGLCTSVAGCSARCTDEDAINAGRVCRAQNGAKIAWFFHAFDQRDEIGVLLRENGQVRVI